MATLNPPAARLLAMAVRMPREAPETAARCGGLRRYQPFQTRMLDIPGQRETRLVGYIFKGRKAVSTLSATASE